MSLSDIKIIYELIRDGFSFWKQKGIVAEFVKQDPFSFNFTVDRYSNLIPLDINIWLKVIFRNTTREKQLLKFAKTKVDNKKFIPWNLGACYLSKSNTKNIPFDLPVAIESKDCISAYLRFNFFVKHNNPILFKEELNKFPEKLIFKVIYYVQKGDTEKERCIEQVVEFKKAYQEIYQKTVKIIKSDNYDSN